MFKESDIFTDFLKSQSLKMTDQRRKILDIFLKVHRHMSVDDLYALVRKSDPAIGHATVFRTLKLLREAGLAKEMDAGDKVRYEHNYGREHHDHLVCIRCSKFIEVTDERMEGLQDALCRKKGFLPQWHKMEIFGVCRECRGRAR